MNPFKKAIDALNINYDKAPKPSEFSAFTGELNTNLDFKTLAKDIPCQAACPAKTNVPAYIEAIAQGDPEKAYRINLEDNVFPGVLGRICTRPCETACRYNHTGLQGPVQICHLKRVAADTPNATPPAPLPPWFEKTIFNIGVIGAGPAGLAAARELTRYGHTVTLFEKEPTPGGMMQLGIPLFRLPRDIIKEECKLITDSGFKVIYGHKIDQNNMPELIEKYDATLLATGAMRPSNLTLPGLPPTSEYAGLDFMQKYNRGEITSLEGQNIIIIGGGFTAVDCARSCARAARRLVGATGNVSIMYRRTVAQMSANTEEFEAMREENIEIQTLVSPHAATTTENGKLQSITFQRNQLGDAPKGHKPPITPIPDSHFDKPCNLLIVAIGQVRDLTILPQNIRHKKNAKAHETTHQKVFIAGDFHNGGKDVITAVEEGKTAAAKIDTYLTGQTRLKKHVAVTLIGQNGETGRLRDHDLQTPINIPTLPLLQRDGKQEVEKTLPPQAAQIASTRCYFCHYKFEIDQDKCIHCDWCIKVAPRDCIKKISRLFHDQDGAVKLPVEATLSDEATYIWIDSNNCVRCGNCLRACPTEAITMRKMSLQTRACPIAPTP